MSKISRRRRRGITEIMASILEACIEENSVTSIGFQSQVCWNAYRPLVEHLVKKGYMNRVANPQPNKHPLALYKTTSRGLTSMMVIQDMLEGL